MFKDEAAILQAAATLAAADRTADAVGRAANPGPGANLHGSNLRSVERLVLVLQDMEHLGLIPAGLAPSQTPASRKP